MPFTLEESGMWLCLLAAARGCCGRRCLLGLQEDGGQFGVLCPQPCGVSGCDCHQ